MSRAADVLVRVPSRADWKDGVGGSPMHRRRDRCHCRMAASCDRHEFLRSETSALSHRRDELTTVIRSPHHTITAVLHRFQVSSAPGLVGPFRRGD